MHILGFPTIITEALDGQRISEVLGSRSLDFFRTGSTQTAYTNVVYPGTHDSNYLPITWQLIFHSLVSLFITAELLRNEHYLVTSARS